MLLGLNFVYFKGLLSGVLNFRFIILNDLELVKVKWGIEEEFRREVYLLYIIRIMVFVEYLEIF